MLMPIERDAQGGENKPAIFNGFGEVLNEVPRDVQNLELWKTPNWVWEGFKLIWVHIQYHHI